MVYCAGTHPAPANAVGGRRRREQWFLVDVRAWQTMEVLFSPCRVVRSLDVPFEHFRPDIRSSFLGGRLDCTLIGARMLSVERAYEDEEPSVWCMIIARRKMFGASRKRQKSMGTIPKDSRPKFLRGNATRLQLRRYVVSSILFWFLVSSGWMEP